jgi:hypothetical protein
MTVRIKKMTKLARRPIKVFTTELSILSSSFKNLHEQDLLGLFRYHRLTEFEGLSKTKPETASLNVALPLSAKFLYQMPPLYTKIILGLPTYILSI